MIIDMLCKRYQRGEDDMIDINKASFELLIPIESVRFLLRNQELKSLKIKDIAKYIKKGELNECKTA